MLDAAIDYDLEEEMAWSVPPAQGLHPARRLPRATDVSPLPLTGLEAEETALAPESPPANDPALCPDNPTRRMGLSEERDLVQRMLDGDAKARDRLVQKNMWLVHYLSNNYQSAFITREDVIQEGYLGLLHAADRFRLDAGCRFASYASFWVRSYMQKALFHAHLIRLPDYLSKAIRGCESRGEQIGDTRVLREQTKQAIETFNPYMLSTHAPDADESPAACFEPVEDTLYAPENVSHQHHMKKVLAQHLNALPLKQRQVLFLRFGFGERPAMGLEEVGGFMGICREPVRQLQNRGLATLNACLEAENLSFDDC